MSVAAVEDLTELRNIGADWLIKEVEELTDHLEHVSPVTFNEENRYLPESVTSSPGYIRYDFNPYMREILDCFDVDSPVREVNLMKGSQVTWTTTLESGVFYFMAHVKTLPIMFITADKELADARIENNFLPMLLQSGFAEIIRSSDTGNTRKTGKTKNHVQFEGGGYLLPFGANNANKMRQVSACVVIKDELDGWPQTVGKDGDPDKLTDDRAKGYWPRRKILRGSTPLLKGLSKIDYRFQQGDQRRYMVICRGSCNKPVYLRWRFTKEGERKDGFVWETEEGTLVPESVRFVCPHCGHEHFEHDKAKLFSEKEGAHWKPFAKSISKEVRSYHLPSMYSPLGTYPWSQCVADYLDAWDPESKQAKDVTKLQVFYNNVLGEPYEISGSRVTFRAVSNHRRTEYKYGQVPNEYARKVAGSPILFLTCQVDVHKRWLAVAVMGWTVDAKTFVIEYDAKEAGPKDPDCTEITCPVWQEVRELIEEKTYVSDDGIQYRVMITGIDASYATDTVVAFCSDYESGVYPIMGRERPAKFQRIQEFAKFKTQAGTTGYRVLVDHYKDRIAPVLRREWIEAAGPQKRYHFNAPTDVTNKQLEELCAEVRREEKDERGISVYRWYRPGSKRNELWDLLVYGHALVEIQAWQICVEHFELETIDWASFWDFAAGNPQMFARTEPQPTK